MWHTTKRDICILLVLFAVFGAGYWYSSRAPKEEWIIVDVPSGQEDAIADPGMVESIATTTDGHVRYSSAKLGISFTFNPSPSPWSRISAVTRGNSVFVHPSEMRPEEGQSVEVFTKRADETLEASIRRQILAEFPSAECRIEVRQGKPGTTIAEIAYPAPADPGDPFWKNAALCNERYAKTNGIRYFLYDPAHSGKFLFFDIGQYAITAEGGAPWQDTVVISDRL